jgi:hypothetical protein
VKQDAAEHLSELLGTVEITRPRKPRAGLASKAVLAAYVERPVRLRAHYKGKVLKARVLRSGVISFAGKRFRSPSKAAGAALPHRRAINGWYFWMYERAPGDWVRLRELRK